MAKKSSAKTLLKRYRAKRDFTRTAEPSGAKAASAKHNSYLIQKHAARRLHYDFRLEMDGVLKSWAVTRGPSLNPEDKRLAVHVEDHPLDYGSFEGTIPQGEYGGGTVMLWDEGSWEPIGDAARDYRKGNMTFELHGKRLKGRWHLVRMHGGKRGDEKHDNWLLIKGKDEFAKDDGDYALQRFQTSVVSDRGMDTIAAGTKVWKSGKAVQEKPKPKSRPVPKETRQIKVAKSKNLLSPPSFIAPQLATLVSAPPTGETWVHEIKYDGYRLLACLNQGKVTLNTRAHNDWTAKFKPIADEVAALSAENALLDGEVVNRADDGTMSFHGLQHALSTGELGNLHYYIFDLLFLDGDDMREKPLSERKKALKQLLVKAPPHLHYSKHFVEPGNKVLSHACSIALEGIVSKRIDAAYHSGRGEQWLKSKCHKEQEIVIGGYTLQPKHPGTLGALLTGYYGKGELIFSGKVGTGFSHEEGRAILKKLQALKQKTSPYKSVPGLAKRGAVWVKPKLVAQIQFTEWTEDGAMRHPSYQGLREDKPAGEVKREQARPVTAVTEPPKKAPARTVALSSRDRLVVADITISHPDKVMYAKDDITKRGLAIYYEKIAPLMLRQIAGRPISLMRCPQGEGKQSFFQRHGSENLSPYVRPVRVKRHGYEEPFLMIEDVQGLVALVQMDVLEIHVWGAKAAAPEKPDRLVFDLDPAPDVAFAEVKKAAMDVRDNLKKLKLVSFLKTTGGKGLHIVVPITPGPDWDLAKAFTRSFAEVMAKAEPGRFTINNRKDVRTGKIYIDYLRNSATASSVAPYSTRAREGAPVSLPIAWEELSRLKSGHDFGMQEVLKRLGEDPWKDIAKIKQRLPV